MVVDIIVNVTGFSDNENEEFDANRYEDTTAQIQHEVDRDEGVVEFTNEETNFLTNISGSDNVKL